MTQETLFLQWTADLSSMNCWPFATYRHVRALELVHILVTVYRGPFLESPEKPLIKLQSASSVNLVFSYIVRGIKIKIKVSFLETASFWRYKEIYVTRSAPEKFRDFRETGPWKVANFPEVENQRAFSQSGQWNFTLFTISFSCMLICPKVLSKRINFRPLCEL